MESTVGDSVVCTEVLEHLKFFEKGEEDKSFCYTQPDINLGFYLEELDKNKVYHSMISSFSADKTQTDLAEMSVVNLDASDKDHFKMCFYAATNS